jgi:hypothetical protein
MAADTHTPASEDDHPQWTTARWLDEAESNPGCDCGTADAVVRLPGGELLCAAEATRRGLRRPTGTPPAPPAAG